VMKDLAPPPSRYPTLAAGMLVEPTREAMGFPTLPGLPARLPAGLINPLLDYDFGPAFNYLDGTGVQTVVPPRIKHVIRLKVPRVDADGNELGGVPVVLHDAPLGTYLGWNLTASGFHKGQICNYAGGMIPFAKTKAQRVANEDPRLSLEERYGSHAGYVAAVAAAARKAVAEGFLLEADATSLLAAAEASDVMR
jgi:Alpha/beta hydrolase domain